jgi:hypothetical protein
MEEKQLENEVRTLRGEVNTLRRQLLQYCHALDEARRRIGLSHIVDDQLEAINARVNDRAM